MMKTITGLVFLLGVLAVTSISLAQVGEDELRRAETEIEEQLHADEELAREVEFLTQEAVRVAGGSEAEVRAAESRLAEAAGRVAELSARKLPFAAAGAWTAELSGRPVLGVSIDAGDDGQPVEGVKILGVSPGGAADEAGLRAGDVLTSINGESLSGINGGEATSKLLDFMSGIEEGDELQVEYLRGGRIGSVAVAPQSSRLFGLRDGRSMAFRMMPGPPDGSQATHVSRYLFRMDDGIGDMEMVTLNEGLGRYFGTAKGLLVIRAPEDAETYKLQDGDVILNIDGREAQSVSHALRILGSYEAGETLSIRIMRDKRERTLEIEIPDRRTGARVDPTDPLAVPRTPAAQLPAAVAPAVTATRKRG